MKTVKSANDLIKGKEYSRDCIEILVYSGKSKFYEGKHNKNIKTSNYKKILTF